MVHADRLAGEGILLINHANVLCIYGSGKFTEFLRVNLSLLQDEELLFELVRLFHKSGDVVDEGAEGD